MVTTHSLGFPRIGKKRELKFALEKYWSNKINQPLLVDTASKLRQENWGSQQQLDFIPVGDESLYDHVLDMSFLVGNIPKRALGTDDNEIDNYFRVARGRSSHLDSECSCIQAGEMTKWFDTNYHYIVPEFSQETDFKLNANKLLTHILEAQKKHKRVKPVIIGPVTYLWLGKSKDNTNKLELLDKLIEVYVQLLSKLENMGVEWIQIDEPILVTELSTEWKDALKKAYQALQNTPLKLLLTTYFGELQDNLGLACSLPIDGLHLDAISAKSEINKAIELLPEDKVLSLGVINGRNIWKADLNKALSWLVPIHKQLKERLWIAPSCSLLHVPVDLKSEQNIDQNITSWLSFAVQKLDELSLLATALNDADASIEQQLSDNKAVIKSRVESKQVHDQAVKKRAFEINNDMPNRRSSYIKRAKLQRKSLSLPLYPTTTIGSFPQTINIRQVRSDFRLGKLSIEKYTLAMKNEIKFCIKEQEDLGLDVFVHGEPERNDMVEYFGEQLTGYAFSQFGWVQSYGSRCVKPPIIYGDISRPKAMTVDWISYAQSLTKKPLKGMLTGPVTILNWSFVRDDQPRSETCLQIALAIRDEVQDIEKAGITMIQIDEAALREGLPLRKSAWKSYLEWAVNCYKITANGVKDDTQIHTHMCYSEFNDIISSIADMDADVITIETSRSDMELLDVFEQFHYPNEIGPGVYDIHSPNIPSIDSMVHLMTKASQYIPAERLWVNPDCGLKTRRWAEVKPALANMVAASKILRKGR